jgi:hypothetical protein
LEGKLEVGEFIEEKNRTIGTWERVQGLWGIILYTSLKGHMFGKCKGKCDGMS